MLDRAGLPPTCTQHRIDLTSISTYTVADFYFESENGNCEGVCVYLDGLGVQAHGGAGRQEQDRLLRSNLDADGYRVIAIPASDLSDRSAMANHFAVIARAAAGRERSNQVRGMMEEWWEELE